MHERVVHKGEAASERLETASSEAQGFFIAVDSYEVKIWVRPQEGFCVTCQAECAIDDNLARAHVRGEQVDALVEQNGSVNTVSDVFCLLRMLEGKETVVNEESGRDRAIEVVQQAIDSYIDRFCK